MKLPVTIFFLLFLILPSLAQNPQSQAPAQTPAQGDDVIAGNEPIPTNYIWPLPSSRLLSPSQLAGKKLFMQRCSVCHLPASSAGRVYGPLLDKVLIEDRGEDVERRQIMQGSLRMPGWQYSLKRAEVDNILDFLKTLNYDSAAKKFTYSPTTKSDKGSETKK